MSERDAEKALEWEGLAEPCTFEHGLELPSPFMPGTRTLRIARDADSLELHLTAEGTLQNPAEVRQRREELDAIPAGTFLPAAELEFNGHGDRCFLRMDLDPVPDLRVSARETIFTQHGRVSRLRRVPPHRWDFASDPETPRFAALGPVAWRSDWFINGSDRFLNERSTKRRRTAAFARSREIGGVRADEGPRSGGSWDHILVETDACKFSVARVPKEHAPTWSGAVSIDYRSPVPDEHTRDGVAEIVSFVLGRRLIPVGSTVFDWSGAVIEDESVSPWGQGIQRLCRRADEEPLPMEPRSGEVERVIGALLPPYLDMRRSLRLSDALLSFWLADEAFTPVDLTLYSSAVEALKLGWFGSQTKSRSGGAHLPEREFLEKFAEPIAAFRAKVQDLELPKSIANKVAGAWRMGGNEQLAAFFDELQLRTGPAEEAAIKARNAPAHGGIKVGADFQKLSRHANAYRVLFVRAFLKILGFTGKYIDRTSIHYPSRSIDEPAGGDPPK